MSKSKTSEQRHENSLNLINRSKRLPPRKFVSFEVAGHDRISSQKVFLRFDKPEQRFILDPKVTRRVCSEHSVPEDRSPLFRNPPSSRKSIDKLAQGGHTRIPRLELTSLERKNAKTYFFEKIVWESNLFPEIIRFEPSAKTKGNHPCQHSRYTKSSQTLSNTRQKIFASLELEKYLTFFPGDNFVVRDQLV